jgi:hypothetical protein
MRRYQIESFIGLLLISAYLFGPVCNGISVLRGSPIAWYSSVFWGLTSGTCFLWDGFQQVPLMPVSKTHGCLKRGYENFRLKVDANPTLREID